MRPDVKRSGDAMENIIFLVTLFSMTGLIVDGRTDLYWLGSAWPHVAGVCKQFLKDKGTETANCPSHSPGWNPVKQLWDIMFWSIRCYLRLPSSLVIWSRYGRRSPEDTIHGLARSHPLTLSRMHILGLHIHLNTILSCYNENSA